MRRLWRDVLDSVTPYDAGQSLERWRRSSACARDPAHVRQRERPRSRRRGWSTRSGGRRRAPISTRTAAPRGAGRRSASGSAVDPSWLVLGNGADELMAILARAAFEPGRRGGDPAPRLRALQHRGDPVRRRRREEPAAKATRPISTTCAPASRRGRRRVHLHAAQPGLHHRAAPARSRRFIDSLGADPPLVMLDEAYLDFCDDRRPRGRRGARAASIRSLISLRTFSKIAGLAGLRMGYAIARPEHHRPVEPGARALQRQPPGPGRGGGRARRPRAPRAHARAWCWRSGRGCRPRWPSGARRRRPRRRTSCWPRSGIERGRCGPRCSGRASWCATARAWASPGHLRIAMGTAEQNRRLLEVWDRTAGRSTGRA